VVVEPGQDLVQTLHEAVQALGRHRCKQQVSEFVLAAMQGICRLRSELGERDQTRPPVRGVGLPGDEAGRHQSIDKAGDVAGADAHGVGENPLGGRAASAQLPQQVCARWGQALAGQGAGHVVVQQDDELENPIECRRVSRRVLRHVVMNLHYVSPS
jgi:hypothetical protein